MRLVAQLSDGSFLRRNGKTTNNLQDAVVYRSRTTYLASRLARVGATLVEVQLAPKWKCPINHTGCLTNCGSYGCGN